MLHIAYRQNGSGRSGHQLKDLFSSVNISTIFDVPAVWQKTWKKQKFLPHDNIQQILSRRLTEYDAYVFYKDTVNHWKGVPFETLLEFGNMVNSMKRSNRNYLLVIEEVFRVHLYQMNCWEVEGLIRKGSFNSSLKILRDMYWGKNKYRRISEDKPVKRIAIHARRGDKAEIGSLEDWDFNHYVSILGMLEIKYAYAEVEISTEKSFSADLNALNNVTINKGDSSDLASDFRKMVTADIFIPSNSGLSVWAAYLAQGKVLIYKGDKIAHFTHPAPPENFIYNDDSY